MREDIIDFWLKKIKKTFGLSEYQEEQIRTVLETEAIPTTYDSWVTGWLKSPMRSALEKIDDFIDLPSELQDEVEQIKIKGPAATIRATEHIESLLLTDDTVKAETLKDLTDVFMLPEEVQMKFLDKVSDEARNKLIKIKSEKYKKDFMRSNLFTLKNEVEQQQLADKAAEVDIEIDQLTQKIDALEIQIATRSYSNDQGIADSALDVFYTLKEERERLSVQLYTFYPPLNIQCHPAEIKTGWFATFSTIHQLYSDGAFNRIISLLTNQDLMGLMAELNENFAKHEGVIKGYSPDAVVVINLVRDIKVLFNQGDYEGIRTLLLKHPDNETKQMLEPIVKVISPYLEIVEPLQNTIQKGQYQEAIRLLKSTTENNQAIEKLGLNFQQIQILGTTLSHDKLLAYLEFAAKAYELYEKGDHNELEKLFSNLKSMDKEQQLILQPLVDQIKPLLSAGKEVKQAIADGEYKNAIQIVQKIDPEGAGPLKPLLESAQASLEFGELLYNNIDSGNYAAALEQLNDPEQQYPQIIDKFKDYVPYLEAAIRAMELYDKKEFVKLEEFFLAKESLLEHKILAPIVENIRPYSQLAAEISDVQYSPNRQIVSRSWKTAKLLNEFNMPADPNAPKQSMPDLVKTIAPYAMVSISLFLIKIGNAIAWPYRKIKSAYGKFKAKRKEKKMEETPKPTTSSTEATSTNATKHAQTENSQTEQPKETIPPSLKDALLQPKTNALFTDFKRKGSSNPQSTKRPRPGPKRSE